MRPATAPRDRPFRPAALLAALAAALTLHALLLGVVPLGWGGGAGEGARPVLQTRTIVLAPPPAAEPAPEAPPPVAAAPSPPAPAPAEQAAAEPSAPPASAPVPEAPPEPAAVAAAEPASAPASAPTGPAATEGGEQVPTYATRLPPAARLAYEVRRGGLSAGGELLWQPEGDRYRLALEASAFALPVLSWASAGAIDAHGLAPDRFSDRRLRRAEQAANFQRERGLISYSGPTVTYPLPPGAQDRLSWMIQLPAILEAEPALRAPGQRIVLFVTGARGDAALWTFEVQEAAPGGVLHLVRAPRKPFDTRVEAWADPARGHLLVRARLGTPDSGELTELQLQP